MTTLTWNEQLVSMLLRGNPRWIWAPHLVARLALGIFFAISGGNKIFRARDRELLYKTLSDSGIQFPEFNTVFVSYVEFVFGLLLIIGLLTAISCLVLMGDMLVAILTTQLATLPSGLSPLDWLDNFLYLPEVLYIILFLWIMACGPGRFSVDGRLLAVRSARGPA